MLGIMNRNVNYKSKDVMKNSILHMSDHTWNIAHKHVTPLSKKTKILERVQRKATKMVRGMSRMTYRERLVSLNMFPVHYRRIRGDLIEAFKIYKGIDKLAFEMFNINSNPTTGHRCKFVKKYARTSLRQTFLPVGS